MIAVDTSVVVAAFATWHEAHDRAARIVAQRPRLPAPCALESYAVLTRLPPPHRAEGDLVRQYLSAAFPAPLMTLSIRRHARLIDDLVALGISGGASYDAVVAMIAAQNGSTLATLDRRAQATYDRVGVGILALQ